MEKIKDPRCLKIESEQHNRIALQTRNLLTPPPDPRPWESAGYLLDQSQCGERSDNWQVTGNVRILNIKNLKKINDGYGYR